MSTRNRTITAPLIPEEEVSGYVPEVIQAQRRLTRRQGMIAKRLYQGLSESGAKMANGKPVRHKTEALLWLLEQLDNAPDQ